MNKINEATFIIQVRWGAFETDEEGPYLALYLKEA